MNRLTIPTLLLPALVALALPAHAERIKDLAETHGAEIFFTHDMEAWGTYRHAPDFYEV